jgi:hypothetical protein
VSDLGPRVEDVFRENYEPGHEYYSGIHECHEQLGDSPDWILQELLETSEEVAVAVLQNMPGSYYNPSDGEEGHFDQCFVSKYPDTYEIKASWKYFKDTLKHKRRFFLNDFKSTLDDFFWKSQGSR